MIFRIDDCVKNYRLLSFKKEVKRILLLIILIIYCCIYFEFLVNMNFVYMLCSYRIA